ncbi:MAG: arylesterase [Gammaproteobacteria bacterium]
MDFNFRRSARSSFKTRLLGVLVFMAVSAALPQSSRGEADPMQPTAGIQTRTILVVGDSLSAGHGLDQADAWVTLLGERLRAEGYGYAVVNASITGDTTTGGAKRLPRALEVHRPSIVIIELGGNDGLRGTPVDVIRQNLSTMIEACQRSGARVILAGMQIPTNYGGPYTQAFAAVYPELAREYRVGLVKFFLKDIALKRELFQADGIHPSAAAQPILLNNVWPVLQPLMKLSERRAPLSSAE